MREGHAGGIPTGVVVPEADQRIDLARVQESARTMTALPAGVARAMHESPRTSQPGHEERYSSDRRPRVIGRAADAP